MRTKLLTCIIAFLIWFLPFVLRTMIKIDFVEETNMIQTPMETIIDQISNAFDSHNNKEAFLLILKNNLKGCIINILGGFFLGLGTITNLSFNGFMSSDVFVTIYNSGFSISNILRTTLPHSFELIGFWLSGAIGLNIARKMIQFMRGRDVFSMHFCKQFCLWTCVVFIIILCAAYVEAYISIKMI